MKKPTESNHPVQEPPKLVEGLDYYWEEGKMVLTSYFLKNRGFCCKNGCRHCPYGFSKDSRIQQFDKSEG